MQGRAFLLQDDLHHFFGIVPGAARVGHEDGLVQAEDGNGHQVADEEIGFNKSKRQRGEEDRKENVEHSLLRVLGADFHHFLAVFD